MTDRLENARAFDSFQDAERVRQKPELNMKFESTSFYTEACSVLSKIR